jgi:hypothetical protein
VIKISSYREKLLIDNGITKIESNLLFQDWEKISQRRYLSEEFIREFQNSLLLDDVSYFQILSEDFIRDFQSKLNWINISAQQKMSDEFLIEFKHEIEWDWYFRRQIPSLFILKKFMIKSSIQSLELVNTGNITKEELQEIKKILAMKYLFTNN